MPRKIKSKRSKYSYKVLTAGVIVLLLTAGLIYYFAKRNNPHTTTDLKPTVSQLPTQSPAASGPRSSSNSNGVNQGTATDNQGQNSGVSSSPSQWTESQSGLVTVKQPAYGSTIKSGDQLIGSAQENQVQFRLIDNQVGVIAQGFLNVVNGDFSGTLNFTSHSSTGRLDVFTTGPTGEEVNEAQVPVNF